MAYDYEHFKADVYKLTDIDLNSYKEKQMKRRIETLYRRKGHSGFDTFMDALKRDRDLLAEFVGYLTINVSQFYRNPEQWVFFEKTVVPYLRGKFGDRLRIWSSACSTGDEPYTIAMILAKYIPLNKVEIIASDIDDAVLAFAKNGVYSEKSLVDLPKDLLAKNFTKVDATHYAISEEIKKHITFKKNNLLKDNYDKNLNMIVCRNVVIYFTDEAKDGVYRRFHRSLVDEGLLFIGSTEQIIRSKELGFESMATFFYKKVKTGA